ncbi:MAG: hypothetical protein U9Q06_01055 [Nanoarchaeota archaeon]|nr:hypothetical protein [Nanoarchaeota archaeon]
MERKTRIASTMVLILLIGIVTAGLIGYLSNQITGTVEVKGPVFYAASGTPIGELLINEIGGEYSYSVYTNYPKIFETEEFDPTIIFYKIKADMYVKAEIEEGTPSKNLTLIFGYYNSTDTKNKICQANVSMNSVGYDIYPASCEADSDLSDIKKFYYEFVYNGEGKIKVSTYGAETKIEITKNE